MSLASNALAPPKRGPKPGLRKRRPRLQGIAPEDRIPAISPRIQRCIQLMVLDGLPRKQAAAEVGLKDRTMYEHFQKPHVMQVYKRMVQMVRNSEEARSIHVAVGIRENEKASDKSRILAMKYIDGAEARAPVQINVGVGVQVSPGYIVGLGEHVEKARQILQLSGSARDIESDQ